MKDEKKEETFLGGCYELEKRLSLNFNCCSTCHVDHEDYGYSLMEAQFENGYYEVCCGAKKAIEKTQCKDSNSDSKK